MSLDKGLNKIDSGSFDDPATCITPFHRQFTFPNLLVNMLVIWCSSSCARHNSEPLRCWQLQLQYVSHHFTAQTSCRRPESIASNISTTATLRRSVERGAQGAHRRRHGVGRGRQGRARRARRARSAGPGGGNEAAGEAVAHGKAASHGIHLAGMTRCLADWGCGSWRLGMSWLNGDLASFYVGHLCDEKVGRELRLSALSSEFRRGKTGPRLYTSKGYLVYLRSGIYLNCIWSRAFKLYQHTHIYI